MSDYRYRRLSFAEFLLTHPELQTKFSDFLIPLLDKSIELIQNTYAVFVVDKYNRNRRIYKKVSWVVFDLSTQSIKISFDPPKVLHRFIKFMIEDLTKEKGQD